nr:hypothetical protein [Tanacetum cinerariifolium]
MKISSWVITDEMKLTENYQMYVVVFRVDVPMTQSQLIESTQGTHRTTSAPRRSTRLTPPTLIQPIAEVDDIILQDIIQLSLAEQKSRNEIEVKQNVQKVEEHLIAEEIKKLVEGAKNVENVEVDSTTFRKNDNQNDPGIRLEPKSNKERPEVEIIADEQLVNVIKEEEELEEDDYELRKMEKGKHVEESRSATSPPTIVMAHSLFPDHAADILDDLEEDPEEDLEEELEEEELDEMEIDMDMEEDSEDEMDGLELIFLYEVVGSPNPPPPELDTSSDSEPEDDTAATVNTITHVPLIECRFSGSIYVRGGSSSASPVAYDLEDLVPSYMRRDIDSLYEIVARRANGSIVSITESDYKNLNKNDIEDMYLLIVNSEVDDYAKTGLLWSLSVFIRSTVIWERVHNFQLGVESYQ